MQSHSTTSDTAGSQSSRNRYVTPAPRPTPISSVSTKRIGMLELVTREGGRPRRRESLLAIFLGRSPGGLSGPCQFLRPAQKEFDAVGEGLGICPRRHPTVDAVHDHVREVAAPGHHGSNPGELGLEHYDTESFAQLGAARTAMQRASPKQRRYVVTVAEERNRAIE